ncbi:MAG: PQQ-binding-like beta-propeller repeat protein, partial [Candidatus Hydrogenedentes bacterium]|nr:PQQ-binding-like beta-propeller repeat protein [Candidatus Hydrogenedentota bacterium]
IDATGTGDITESGELWAYSMDTHCACTPAIANGLAFITDCRGVVHCVDADTGAPYWTHELSDEIWASTLVADGKVYAVSRGRDFCVFAAAKEKQVLAEIKLPQRTASTPVAANGVLYVATMDRLYAIQESGGQ